MTKCAVLNCFNSPSRSGKLNISFHRFPSDPYVKEKWINATGSKNWFPTKNSTMCSIHFAQNNFTVTNKLPRLLKSAIPTIQILKTISIAESSQSINYASAQESNYVNDCLADEGETVCHKEICRVCLRTDQKLNDMQKYGLEEHYLNLIGVMPRSEPALPQAVCGFCAHQLRKFLKLQQSARLANDTLHRLLSEHGRVSEEILKAIEVKPMPISLVHCALSPISFSPIKHDDNDNLDPISIVDKPVKDKRIKEEMYLIEVDVNDGDAGEDFGGLQTLVEESTQEKVEYQDEASVNDESGYVDDDMGEVPHDAAEPGDDLDNKAKKGIELLKRKKASPDVRKGRKRKIVIEEEFKRYFTIIELSTDEQIEIVMKRRESDNYRRSQYKCDYCYRGFNRQDTFEQHLKKHTDATKHGQYVCSICKLRAKSVHMLQRHNLNHKREYRCNACSFVTFIKAYAKNHHMSHQGAKIICPRCNMSFDKGTSYLSHLRLVHPSNFACELCGYSFVSLHGIKSHKNLKHRYDNQQIPADAPSCEVCDIKFISEEALRTHQRVSPKHQEPEGKRHRNRMPIPAKDQRSRVKTTNAMTKGAIPCERCDEELDSPRAYFIHFRAEHPGANRTRYPGQRHRVMCHVCGRICQTVTAFRDHMKTHASERACKCSHCPKTFKTEYQLSAHRRAAHQRTDPGTACPECGRAIRHYSNLRRHMLLHKAERPYPCELCPRRFPNKGHRDAHRRHKHFGEPYRSKRERHTLLCSATTSAANVNEIGI